MNTTGSLRVLVLSAALMPLFGCGEAQDPAVSTGKLRVLSGEVTIVHRGQSRTVKAADGAAIELACGDTVTTGPQSVALLEKGHRTHVLLREKSEMRVDLADTGPDESLRKVSILRGILTFWLQPDGPKAYRFEASTGTVVAAVKGTQFTIDVNDQRTSVTMAAGQVALYKPQTSTVGGLAPDGKRLPDPQEPPADQLLKRLDANDRDGRMATVAQDGSVRADPIDEEAFNASKIALINEAAKAGIDISTF